MMVELRLLRVPQRFFRKLLEVYRCREIAIGFIGTLGSRAKVSGCCVMLVGSRKIAYRYVGMIVGRSEDYYGLFWPVWSKFHTGFNFILLREDYKVFSASRRMG